MKQYYFAVFVPELEGNFSVYFPDLPGAVTGGCNLGECLEYGADILDVVLRDMSLAKKEIPTPSNQEEVAAKVVQMRAESGLAMPQGVHYQLFRAPELNLAPVKITVSLPKAVLEDADRKAKMSGLTRSGFLAQAVRAYEG